MACADALADFTTKKSLRGSPETAQEESEKVSTRTSMLRSYVHIREHLSFCISPISHGDYRF